MAATMPAVFLGHGNPMNALQSNSYTKAWASLGAAVPRPRAILCVSAHWYVAETAVTAMSSPPTIHDFGGFPRELFEVTYPASGDADLAARVGDLLAPVSVRQDHEWGLDHGAWSVLKHVYPDAGVPVVQLSIDQTKGASFHYETARRLSPLRDEGVLVLGSGNLVHNLRLYGWGKAGVEPYDWAVRFERQARELLLAGNDGPLVDYQSLGPDAMLAVPTPEHYLPLLYVLALRREGEQVSFPVEGMDGGSVSMLAVRMG